MSTSNDLMISNAFTSIFLPCPAVSGRSAPLRTSQRWQSHMPHLEASEQRWPLLESSSGQGGWAGKNWWMLGEGWMSTLSAGLVVIFFVQFF